MLVIAGAGTGKTTVLTQRVANLIREGHARPDEILALTYTDNSAAEMMARVRGELKGIAIDGLHACTFHAWCNGLLQRCGADFGVLDDKDLWVYCAAVSAICVSSTSCAPPMSVSSSTACLISCVAARTNWLAPPNTPVM